MKIYLITHPDTVPTSEKVPPKWKISEDGWKQVRSLAKRKFWSEVEFIYASTEPKAHLAGRYWAKKHRIPMKIVEGIDEIRKRNQFLRKKQLWENVDYFYANPAKSARGWETARNCLERMLKAFNRIVSTEKKKKRKAIAVVSHGAVANLYVCHLKKIKPSRKVGQKKIGSWIVIDTDRKKVLTKWRAY
ncbi:MAG TPA: histidine phosphatase family protein [archaeon]|nr:histidine phosphatase family protein [archaeon]